MRYAKLINNFPIYAPNPLTVNGFRIGNPSPELLLEQGYKPLQLTNQPEPQGIGWWEETWTETDGAIVQGWIWHEATDEDEIDPEEALNLLLGGEFR